MTAVPSIPSAPAAAAPAAPAAAQPGFMVLNIQRPLMSVWGAALLLNRDEEFIERLLEDGKLAWAFDIGSPGSTARCVRILTRCVLDYRAAVENSFSLAMVLNLIFPESRARFRLHDVAFAWHTSQEQVRRLIKTGALAKVPGTGRMGAGNGVIIPRPSLVDFLSSRLIA